MTIKETIHNSLLGFTTKEEGFSVKKQIAAVSIAFMFGATLKYTNDSNWEMIAGMWFAFIASLLGIGAVEKHISQNNETKRVIAETESKSTL